jgi:5,10-methylene-tetrahydrofolate dehydrogenase/methenyl tetrahydrofolate cyclohydrolase
MAVMLMNAGATVISCNIDTPDIYKYTKKSDIVIMATGVP